MTKTQTRIDCIICKDEAICKFYSMNPEIDFELINKTFITMLQHSINSASPNYAINPSDKLNNKFIDNELEISKDNYIKQLEAISDESTTENIAEILEKQNSRFLCRIQEIVKLSELAAPQCENIVETIASLANNIKQSMSALDNSSIKDFIANYDMKISMLLQNIQQPVYSLITASEERINNNINTIKSISTNQTEIHAKFLSEIGDVLTSSQRANSPTFFDNKMLSNVLTKAYSSSEIILPTSLNEDELILKRLRKQNIMFKNYMLDSNVPSDDISIFIQTVDDNNCNGIFVSQQSGISTKKNYQIDIHNNRIIVYIHNAEYNPHKIQIAVDIIDNLSSKLHQYKTKGEDNDFHIPKDVLDTINNEYQLFVSQKGAIVEVFKEQQKKVLAQIDELKFPVLDKILATKYLAPTPKPGLKCELCKSYFANNLKALAAHKRGCIRKQNNRASTLNSTTLSTITN